MTFFDNKQVFFRSFSKFYLLNNPYCLIDGSYGFLFDFYIVVWYILVNYILRGEWTKMNKKLKVGIESSQNLNISMLILQCIGIIAVVLGHANLGGGQVYSFIFSVFPYYSWHMPFFIFISGYFFNRDLPVGKYIVKKLRNHLLPALLVNAAFGVLSMHMKKFGLTGYGGTITWKSLFVTPFTSGYEFRINVSLWFIFALFVIEIVSCLMDRIARKRADIPYLIVTFIVAGFCCYMAFYKYDSIQNEFLCAGVRFGFLMFFFWLGICYRRYFEKVLQSVLNIKISLIIFVVQALVLGITGYKIIYYTREMKLSTITVPHGFWVAIVAPVIAIVFFLGIAYSLSPYLKESKILSEFGRNTKYVVYYHQFLFVFFSIVLGALIKLNVLPEIPGFSFETLYSNKYYTGGNAAISWFIVVHSVLLPVVVCGRLKKLKWYIKALIYLCIFALTVLVLFLASKVI